VKDATARGMRLLHAPTLLWLTMKKSGKTTRQSQSSGSGITVIRNSPLDYVQYETRRCEVCQRRFKAEQIVRGGEVIIKYSPECRPCLRSGRCSTLPLLSGLASEPARHSMISESISDECAMETSRRFSREFAHLYLLAENGDERAARTLFEVLSIGCSLLENLALHQMGILQSIARKKTTWPLLAGRKVFYKRRAEAMLARLELGTESAIGGEWDLDKAVNQQSLMIYYWLLKNRDMLALPELSEATQERWFAIAWHGILYATRGRPEDDTVLRTLGESAGRKKPKFCKNLGERTSRSNARSRIKERLWQSFRSFTRDSFPRK
jgi:hypothetical protein